jgi:hypothetical protein
MSNNDFGKKPDNTKIQLTKGGDCFEVYIPPLGFHPVILFIAPFAIFWYGVINFWTLMATQQVPFPGNIFVMMCSLLFWAAGCFQAYLCLFILFGKTYFRIDRHEVSLIKTIFGFKISREQSEPKREITKLIFTRKHPSRNNNEDTPAALKIEIGVKSIELGGLGGGIKNESEVKWLALEVSEWLNKPLTII